MELRQLEYFEAVYRYKNFTKAAQELHVTQPTVTTAIKNLEKELGVPVFDREGGGLELTPAGEELLLRTQVILRNVHLIYSRVREADTYRKQQLSIGIPPISCAQMYPLAMGEFARSHPNIDVRVQDTCNHETILQILRDDLELGFIILPEDPNPNIEFLSLEEGSVLVLLSDQHPLSRQRAVRLEDLVPENIFMYEKGTSYVEVRLEEEFRRQGLPWNIRQYFSNVSTIYDLVSQNFGIAFTLPTTSPLLGNMPGLVTRPLAEPIHYEIGLAWGRNKFLSTACREFIHFINEKYPQAPGNRPAEPE